MNNAISSYERLCCTVFQASFIYYNNGELLCINIPWSDFSKKKITRYKAKLTHMQVNQTHTFFYRRPLYFLWETKNFDETMLGWNSTIFFYYILYIHNITRWILGEKITKQQECFSFLVWLFLCINTLYHSTVWIYVLH